jgi:hypothetical protein
LEDLGIDGKNVKIYLSKIGFAGVDWLSMTLDRDKLHE